MKTTLPPKTPFLIAGLAIFFVLFIFIVLPSKTYAQEAPLFELLSSSKSGINFKNQLKEDAKHNILTYEYFYNGGGVAIGDINNDGLEDIFLTANMGKNALYLNTGSLKFKDISKSAKIEGKAGAWSTGVSMIDINKDGLLDIYVCYSGWQDEDARRNALYINRGNGQFEEKATEYGLDDPSNSTQAAFFDYDKDGDLDMYLLNHNTTVIYEVEYNDVRDTRHPLAGDKFYENEDGHFTDISEKAGIKGSPLGFGLGIAIADVNSDGWQDIYVSNDYIEPDYLYINQGDGTFTDQMTDYFQHISYFSMGSDIVDVNNDGQPDVYTLDMLPEDNERQKLLYGPDNYEHYALMVMNGFYHQNMRNMLHVNNANGGFSEVGQLAGISNTDWSWSSFFADFDNDGWKDLFITNGYYRDYTNRDFLKYKGDYFFQKAVKEEKADTFQLVTSMTSTPLHNYIFKNEGDLNFTDKSIDWGFNAKTFSNGAAYADLDNDGDLDLVVNNLNEKASLYKNLSREQHPDGHYLAITLKGKDITALGAKLKVYSNEGMQFFEYMPTRGFQSSMSQRIHIGLGKTEKVDSMEIQWLSGNRQIIKNAETDQLLTIEEEVGETKPLAATDANSCLFQKVPSPVPYLHQEYAYNDFKRQPLLMNMLTTCGPTMTMADINQDQLPDIFIGGAKGSFGKIYIQNTDGQYMETQQHFASTDQINTDADAVFFDADGDGDQDLYVASGGYQDFSPQDLVLQDNLYLNDGQGDFEVASEALPAMFVSKSCVVPADFDQDGDMDVFVGGRVIPGQFPVTPQSFLLENNGSTDGKPHFSDVAADKAPGLSQIGMVTDAAWIDLNNDGWQDLIVIGEYMPIKVYLNQSGKGFADATEQYFDRPLSGLWNKLLLTDFDNDGDQDMVVANFGLNSQLKVSPEKPLKMFYKDFDANGSVDPILTYYIQGKAYPFASRGELLDQIYSMRQKYTSYADYAGVQLEDIFSKDELKDAQVLTAETLETIYLENQNGKFVPHQLPKEAQFAPVYAMTTLDYNKDGNPDLVLAGNQSAIRIRMGVMDANYGQVFEGDGQGNFTYISQAKSGLNLKGDVKAMESIKIKDETYLLIGINNAGVEAYKLTQP